MSDPQSYGQEENRMVTAPVTPHPRAVGSPLPRGSVRRPAHAQEDAEGMQLAPPPPGRAPAGTEASAHDSASSVQRAVNAIRAFVPFVQRVLPLLDGNIATAVANVLAPHAQPPAPPVDLAPLEDSVTALETQHRELRDQIVEQNTSLKRVEDQFEMVREATDRNTLEQQELMEDIKAVGAKANVVALVALALLAVSVILNVILYLHIQRVLP